MPSFIIKADPDTDLYAEWSTVVESPVKIGTREWMLADGRVSPDRLDRADAKGSSTQGDIEDWYSWSDAGWIYRQEGFLPRSNLKEALQRILENPLASVRDLLTPFEDDE